MNPLANNLVGIKEEIAIAWEIVQDPCPDYSIMRKRQAYLWSNYNGRVSCEQRNEIKQELTRGRVSKAAELVLVFLIKSVDDLYRV